jgi:NAD(P)-dependent dehydrogenase (short-subunit alcohol dehydrogenase family)
MNLGLDGRVAIVTGAGRGLGRAYALGLAARGVHVVVNDLKSRTASEGASPAEEVVGEIQRLGGTAVADTNDVSTWAGARALVTRAVRDLGRLDIVVNNAGVYRGASILRVRPSDWTAMSNVHGRGYLAMSHFACRHWAGQARTPGRAVYGRLIHVTSRSGLYGNEGQCAYDYTKAGVAAMSLAIARDMLGTGVTSNAIAPTARTPMTEAILGARIAPAGNFDVWDPSNVAPFVVFLSSEMAAGVSGQVFVVRGGEVQLIDQYHPARTIQRDGRWTAEELADALPELFVDRSQQPAIADQMLGVE